MTHQNTQQAHTPITPLPWRWTHDNEFRLLQLVGANGEGVNTTTDNTYDAIYITLACNAYHDLLTALRTIATQSTDPKAQGLASMAYNRATNGGGNG